MDIIIGREKEKKELERLYDSLYPEFVSVCGRRRVGKTFLITEFFKNKISFSHTGLSPIELKNKKMSEQLSSFYNSLKKQGLNVDTKPKTWYEAFDLLEVFLNQNNDKKQIIFIDEIQWLDTPKSSFITALELFWNGWASRRNNLMLIVCGSSSSWISNKLINNHGGLYDRITYQIELEPFNLHECEEYFNSIGIQMSRYDITQSYMAVGGIPYYLHYFNNDLSFPKNIDNIFFDKKGKLRDEFDKLFASIFTNHEMMKKIVKALNSKKSGLTRNEIIDKTGIQSSGQLSTFLNALIASDIIIKYNSIDSKNSERLYKLIDPFCLFYLNFVQNNKNNTETYFENIYDSQRVTTWKGLMFENVCINHIKQIKKALGISGVSTEQSIWSKKGIETDVGTQIDIIITRKDNIVNLCEIKFFNDIFSLDKEENLKIERRKNMLRENYSSRYSIHPILITTFGINKNAYSKNFVNILTLDDLFDN